MRNPIIRRATAAAASLALLLAAGCILTSGQFLVSFDLDDPLSVTSPTNLVGSQVDLNTIDAYNDHKDDLEDLSDLALVGDITNLGAPIEVEFWITTEATTLLTAAAVRAHPSAVLIWGPLPLASGETRRIDWDQSAGLFRGRQSLVSEVKGDGVFTIYVLGPQAATVYNFRVDNGVLVLVIDAGV